MKKILIIHTGGTFGMTPIEPDEQLAPGNIQNQILQYIPEIQNLAEIDVVIPFNLDSSNIGFREWEILSDLIHNNIDNYEGFVVIHGTDTMVYSASALSFSLRNLRKPIVLTGSQRPLSKLRTDARFNLIDAVEMATMDIPEVLITFGQKILRGNRAKKNSITDYNAFDSPNYPLIGEIGINIQINYEYVLNPEKAYFYEKGFSNNLSVLSIYPSLNLDNYLPVLDSEINGIILRGFGAGHLPTILPNWMDFLKNARDKNIMIFIGSHSRHGSVNLDLYESGKEAKDLGAISLGKMTIEAAYVKLMRIFNQTTSRQKVIEVLRTSWAGEI
jgi:L-asparaginase